LYAVSTARVKKKAPDEQKLTLWTLAVIGTKQTATMKYLCMVQYKGMYRSVVMVHPNRKKDKLLCDCGILGEMKVWRRYSSHVQTRRGHPIRTDVDVPKKNSFCQSNPHPIARPDGPAHGKTFQSYFLAS
jgi:hypothetical protein